jgi:rubrerythrin
MDDPVSGFEVIEIAEKIERNGARFYRKAAALCRDPDVCKLLVELGQWEARHVKVFQEMKERSADEDWGPDDISLDRIRRADAGALAGLAVFGRRPNPQDELTGQETREGVLKMAIEKEKESIVYYAGLKDLVPNEADKKMIEDIIEEEKKHVRILAQSLERYG